MRKPSYLISCSHWSPAGASDTSCVSCGRIHSGSAERAAAVRAIGLSNLFDRQAPGGKRAKQLGFRESEIKPSQPVRAVEDDHLSIVNRRHVWTGIGCQEREGVPCPIGHRAPQACEAEPVLAGLGEFPLRFRRFRAGELEEVRRRDEAPPFGKPSPFGAEIDDRRSFWPRRRKAPA